MSRVIGFKANAEVLCPPHAAERYGLYVDGGERLDREDNEVYPIFSTDEFASDEVCGACLYDYITRRDTDPDAVHPGTLGG